MYLARVYKPPFSPLASLAVGQGARPLLQGSELLQQPVSRGSSCPPARPRCGEALHSSLPGCTGAVQEVGCERQLGSGSLGGREARCPFSVVSQVWEAQPAWTLLCREVLLVCGAQQ